MAEKGTTNRGSGGRGESTQKEISGKGGHGSQEKDAAREFSLKRCMMPDGR